MRDITLSDRKWKEVDQKPGVYIKEEDSFQKFSDTLKDIERVKTSILDEIGEKLTEEQRCLLKSL